MADGLKHTSAADQAAFMAKPPSVQLLEIWLNGRETNGSVADAQRDIAAMGLEIQKARLDLSAHLLDHPAAEILQKHIDEAHDASVNVGFIKRMGAAGTAGLATLILGIGGALTVLQIVILVRNW